MYIRNLKGENATRICFIMECKRINVQKMEYTLRLPNHSGKMASHTLRGARALVCLAGA